MQAFSDSRNELSLLDRCVLWGSRVVVPKAGREKVLDELHEGHPGGSRMKGLARGVVWRPGIYKAIEERVKSCYFCQQGKKSPAMSPLHPWEWLNRPWSCLHVDYAGPFMGKMFLITVDA